MNTTPFNTLSFPGKKQSGDSVVNGVDLSVNFAGIKAPNPFWLASAPPTDKAYNVVRAYEGDDAIFVLYPKKIAAAARTFLNGFPGKVLYAVKANPHPAVLKTLWTSGVRNFDVASTREVDLVQSVVPGAKLFFMHPVKSRAAIRHAYDCGVRDFSFDTADELQKMLEVTVYRYESRRVA